MPTPATGEAPGDSSSATFQRGAGLAFLVSPEERRGAFSLGTYLCDFRGYVCLRGLQIELVLAKPTRALQY